MLKRKNLTTNCKNKNISIPQKSMEAENCNPFRRTGVSPSRKPTKCVWLSTNRKLTYRDIYKQLEVFS